MADKKSMKNLKPVKGMELEGGDKLERIMAMQLSFMERIGIHPDKMPLAERERVTKEVVLAMHDELSEVLNWTNWKPWKKERTEVDQHEIRFEIIDLLHFLLELAAVWGMTADDVAAYYIAKNRENQKRQDDGY